MMLKLSNIYLPQCNQNYRVCFTLILIVIGLVKAENFGCFTAFTNIIIVQTSIKIYLLSKVIFFISA